MDYYLIEMISATPLQAFRSGRLTDFL